MMKIELTMITNAWLVAFGGNLYSFRTFEEAMSFLNENFGEEARAKRREERAK